MNNYTNILRTHNLKATPQRIEILTLIESFGHINIDTLYENIKHKYQSISLATIYKNINAMIKEKLLLEVKLPNQKSVYETIKHNHSHLLCNKCHNIIDIDVDINNIIDDISNKNQFKIDKSDLVLSGICKNCQ
jgi:Fur family peroxide stress response transcriptional regulator